MSAEMETVNSDQIELWNAEVGDKWVRYQTSLDSLFRGATERLLGMAAPTGDEAVLDIGCGTGDTTLALAQCLGPDGRVLGVDVSRAMLGWAQERAATASATKAAFVLADAQAHTFAAEGFDLLVSRFGVMFFEDPVAAFANMLRAMKPGGRLAMMCWTSLAGNPWFALPREVAIRRMGPPPAADPKAPGPLAFSEQDYVLGILQQAGWRDCKIAVEEIPLSAKISLEDVAWLSASMGPATRIVMAHDGGQEDVMAIAKQLEVEFRPFMSAAGFSIPATFNVITAQR